MRHILLEVELEALEKRLTFAEPSLEDRKDEELFVYNDIDGTASKKKKRRGLDDNAPKKLKLVNAMDISRDDITILEKGRGGKTGTILVTYHPVSLHIAHHHFDILIGDVGQCIRRVSGSYTIKSIKALERLIFFDVCFAPGLVGSRNVGPLSLMEQSFVSYASCGQFFWYPGVGLYHPAHDPSVEDNVIISEAGDELGTRKSIFSDEFIESVESDIGLSQALQILKRASCEGGPIMGVTRGSKVVKPRLQFLYIRRTMKTPIEFPGGKVSYPSDGMLPSRIRVEECLFNTKDLDAALVKQIEASYADSLFTASSASLREYTQPAQSLEQPRDNSPEVNLNVGQHRAGFITAFDPHS
ncbi:unnamed protein product [Fusarium venenatum]|uniref:Uncharacterized protein n=1 Tax=Fusarium venenatum TaxID=56646 RepID=A0A2L2TJG2_9HYPO|nr:uncharacterized protein FVRRES_07622 [Fusarium venenatum]CEI63186.1 unnamed protein product [Fusarium venenatum]